MKQVLSKVIYEDTNNNNLEHEVRYSLDVYEIESKGL